MLTKPNDVDIGNGDDEIDREEPTCCAGEPAVDLERDAVTVIVDSIPVLVVVAVALAPGRRAILN